MSVTPSNVSLWAYRTIPFTFENGYPYQQEVIAAMNQWETAAGVTFVQRTDEPNYLYIQQAATTDESSIGMKGGKQVVGISQHDLALHELGHVIGLAHEHSRSDRDDHIDMQWQYIDGGQSNTQFVKDRFSNNLTAYDRLSVMHYPAPATGWGGYPADQQVWTMLWRQDNSIKLGAGDNQGYTVLSDDDKSPNGMLALYQQQRVPMGPQTASGKWKNPYPVEFAFVIAGQTYAFQHNPASKAWYIQELLPDGSLGKITAKGTWYNPYEVQFPFTVGDRVFYYGQNLEKNNWFIQELLPGGLVGNTTDTGTWKHPYQVQFPYTIGGRVFFYGQNTSTRYWFLQELLPAGKMGKETANGTWGNPYEVQFSYTIGSRVFYYGQNMTKKTWFIQELLPEGKMGQQLSSGTWAEAYETQFPYSLGGVQYFYGQNMASKNWFIRQLNPDGTMGVLVQAGRWDKGYQVQFPYVSGYQQYFFGHSTSDYSWFIRQLLEI
ncbi:Astacin (Peptidase family M12A) [Chitinophaga eiseniae]|uniref:Astacin (Peptidase family M12A) n=1 Tax=Chitinophaga eiseniae TaxID=634771 RepID=A0A1T4T6S8_9BACT|nr:M12 family metallopeptidase [Chitinophaga eiseniae]SKA36123.1 Astacin (Peptidase family M12A) [Chitinophaga eiseniae]